MDFLYLHICCNSNKLIFPCIHFLYFYSTNIATGKRFYAVEKLKKSCRGLTHMEVGNNVHPLVFKQTDEQIS